MKRKIASGLMLTLLLIGMLTLAFNIQPVEAGGTIYIRPDGSVEGTDRIQRDGDVYTFTGNIYDEIVVERNNTIIDGNGYTLQGSGSGNGYRLYNISHVTVKNTNIKGFTDGIKIKSAFNITIFGNNITNNDSGIFIFNGSANIQISGNIIENNYYGGFQLLYSSKISVRGNHIMANNQLGILFYYSSNNSISGNNVTNNFSGIHLHFSSNNTMSGNNVANNYDGVHLSWSSNNSMSGNHITNSFSGVFLYGTSDSNIISGNNLTEGNYGIFLDGPLNNIISQNDIIANEHGIRSQDSSNNLIYHNNFINNLIQASTHDSTNIWDDGYPSGGNYWSDYENRYPEAEELDGSGIWDTPYEIDENNRDNYPLIEPWTPLPRTIDELRTEIEELGSEGEIDNQGIVKSLIAKLNVVQRLVDKGKVDEAKTILADGFIRQVQNLSGIHITPEAVDILIKSAEYVLSNL